MPKRPRTDFGPNSVGLLDAAEAAYYRVEDAVKLVAGDWDAQFAGALADGIEESLRRRADEFPRGPRTGVYEGEKPFQGDLEKLRRIEERAYKTWRLGVPLPDVDYELTKSSALLLGLQAELAPAVVYRLRSVASDADALLQQPQSRNQFLVAKTHAHMARQLARAVVDLRLGGHPQGGEVSGAIGMAYATASERLHEASSGAALLDDGGAKVREVRDFAKEVTRTALHAAKAPSADRIAALQQAGLPSLGFTSGLV